MAKQILKSHCGSCSQETNHRVVSSHKDSFREDYAFDHTFQIVECLGCNNKAFREVQEEIEHSYQISENEWEVPTTISLYPKYIKGHRQLIGAYHLPELVGLIYKEVLLAYQEDALILSGLGLRGTVEAVCNDLEIKGRTLEVRITKLANSGYISKNDADRLHSIRFMGNDAAHDIKKPKATQFKVALKIVEHLLSSVYILEKEVQGNLETIISSFDHFEELLNLKAKSFSSGEELPLSVILGRDLRRVKDNLITLEAELVKKITNGKYNDLSVGKLAKYQSSKHDLQHFKIK